MDSRYLSLDDLNRVALEHFVYQPVGRDMISYLAVAAQNVITCDPTTQSHSELPPTPPKSPQLEKESEEKTLPTVEEFITQLVVSSNVQVATLMSSLVYLNRLKARLQPQARGIRCTAHRIFLASLILAAKYLNDSSPKNKHWAKYTNITTECYQFGFSRTEVNTMEKQLLFLLEWDLRIDEEDLYRELDFFLEPLRQKISERHIRKMQQREEKRRHQAARQHRSSPIATRAQSRSRNVTPEHTRSISNGSTPPGLSYSSSASSYASSISSSHHPQSRSATPLESEPDTYAFAVSQPDSLYESPVQIVMEAESKTNKHHYRSHSNGQMLPYEISTEQYQQLQEDDAKKRPRRGVWGRIWGAAVAAR